tara:strand:- start:8 stop:280 length:273 start_codon:yes stop_codon:yes gene_type:complete
MKIFKSIFVARIFLILKIFILIKFFFMATVFNAFSGEDFYEGKEADRIIKLGLIQETIKEENHKHLVIEYDNDFFWCTIEKNGNKSCVLY